jgi:uncharacterized protein
MPTEPGIVDANILIYAMDADAPQHAVSRALLEAAQQASLVLYVTPQILCEFYSIVTNPRRVPKPRTPADACQALSRLLGFLQVLPVPPQTFHFLLDLLNQYPVTGGDVFDLQIVATMRANAVHKIYTFNTSDFDRFAGLSVVAP